MTISQYNEEIVYIDVRGTYIVFIYPENIRQPCKYSLGPIHLTYIPLYMEKVLQYMFNIVFEVVTGNHKRDYFTTWFNL